MPDTTPSSHTAFTALPSVDIAGLFSADSQERQKVANELGDAARDVGFLYITGHGVAPEIRQRLIDRAQEYFARPLDEKMRFYIGQSENHSGYVPEGEEKLGNGAPDFKEAYDVNYDYLSEQGRHPMLGPNQWPDAPGFKEDVQAYYRAALKVADTLFRGFALALGLEEDALSRNVNHPPSQLRMIHYPFNAEAPSDRPGIGAHTDYECFTILLPTAPGLEVINGAGEWIDVPLQDDAFVINIGDMLEVLSNGQFVATSHRVRKVKEERYSFPLFCACDYETEIAPIASLPKGRQDREYETIKCGDHLYAQTIHTFGYLKEKLARGEISLPENARNVDSFGYHGL
ncbi:isopenicillin N synthase family oxygenase [Gilvimarinus agarilyticus]|uniref:isopenicillin N synthase family dioxygenase n=1 Tax=unclassified Gilvimarinus TaxID=2642066 RepID=UPI001C08AAA3|nr:MULTISPECIES: 2-oxoglutarate and iron-dependent oxygenase domain-containing protein [unclassified Gilvimarinus]MBU2884589.1 isopenicillin N synthase family oxygenase [Gilvimarinus agarilyticus]MDO6569698.1 2-oxoglutarate and iron-dependent oxygenase domain-containing protein [Gilvimarinus sp. 2_MG-2023]MDO6748060.1 2-oxoglutarate and iron-dependent oxygenase domain-containing protein [Gilvimarinus sp. 1_MG-2023]